MNASFKIGEEEYEIPEVINLDTFQRSMAWYSDDLKNTKPFLSSVSDCPLTLINLLDDETVTLLTAAALQRMRLDGIPKRNVFHHQLKDFNNLTFGEFIDLDILIQGGPFQNAVAMVSKLYDADEKKVATWNHADVFPAILEFANFRTLVYNEYREFFGDSSDGSSDTQSGEDINLQLMWYEAVMVLAEGVFLNIHQVVERPFREALNFLTYKKAQIAKQQLEQVKRKYDIQKRNR